MFPFAGKPRWAQLIGEFMPADALVRAIMLKGLTLVNLKTLIAVTRFRRTPD